MGCKSKDGRYSASSWSGTAPWPYTPFNGTSSNGGAIEQWLLADDGTGSGYKNATTFVKSRWPSPNDEISKKFKNGEYVLVIETIMSFQPHVSSSGSSSGGGGGSSNSVEVELNIQSLMYSSISTAKLICNTIYSYGCIMR